MKMKNLVSALFCMALCAIMSGCSSESDSTVTEASSLSAESTTASADSADEIITEKISDTASDVTDEMTVGESSEAQTNESTDSGSMAVAYFSATGNTADIAQKIADITGADIYEIVPEIPYTADDLDYSNDNCRANIEMNDSSARPAISGDMTALTEYDTVFIGYPIWWGTAPRIIDTFFDSYDMSGKTIYTFCTSGGSGIGQSISDLTDLYPDISISDGMRFNAGASEDDVREWLDGLN